MRSKHLMVSILLLILSAESGLAIPGSRTQRFGGFDVIALEPRGPVPPASTPHLAVVLKITPRLLVVSVSLFQYELESLK